MSYAVKETVPFYVALENMVNDLTPDDLPSGIILAASREIKEVMLKKITEYFDKEAPQAELKYFYDQQYSIFGILAGKQTLSDSHFHALYLKDYLEKKDVLTGQFVIGSLPEDREAAVQMLIRMFKEVVQEPGKTGEISIYNPELTLDNPQSSILIVNHDETVNEFLNNYLYSKGYDVHIANNGQEGIEKYLELSPRVVITDLNLPIVDGYQLIHKIKNREQSANDPKIMVLTNKRLEKDIKRSFEMGVSDYMVKPFSPVELEVRIKRLFA